MQDKTQRLPAPKAALPDFAPVPRQKPRHDGWTPERQRAFVEALADTGCVQIAARMVNMSPESAYMLRRAPGAEGFRKAWEAAQGLGLQVVKDEAFHRAMHGQLVPVFVAGKLMGFRRKKNDRLLMFILRHYGQDAAGRRTTINYFSTRATAGHAGGMTQASLSTAGAAQSLPSPLAGEGRLAEGERGEGAGGKAAPNANLTAAEASTTTVKTVITGAPGPSEARPGDDDAARLLETFAGVDLDDRAKADIYRALEQAAERRRALDEDPAEDPDSWYIAAEEAGDYAGELETGFETEEPPLRAPGEHRWESLGEGGNAAEIDRAVAEMAAARQLPSPRAGEGEPPSGGEGEGKYAPGEAKVVRAAIDADLARRTISLPPPDPDDPILDWRNWQTGEYVEPPYPPLDSEGSAGSDCPRLSEIEPGAQSTRHWTAQSAVDGQPHSSTPDDPEPAAPNRPGEGKRKRTYRKRKPKPAFTGLDEEAEARAREEVAANRRGAAEAEAGRRRNRKRGEVGRQSKYDSSPLAPPVTHRS